MGLDWRTLTWWEYQAALHGWNERSGPQDSTPPIDSNRQREIIAAHSLN